VILFSIIGILISLIFSYDTFGPTEDHSIVQKQTSKGNHYQYNKYPLTIEYSSNIIAKYRYSEFIMSVEDYQVLRSVLHSESVNKLLFVEQTKIFKNIKNLKVLNPLNNDILFIETKNANIDVWIFLILVLMLFPLFTFFVEKPSFNFVFFAINYNLYGFPISLLFIIIYSTPILDIFKVMH